MLLVEVREQRPQATGFAGGGVGVGRAGGHELHGELAALPDRRFGLERQDELALGVAPAARARQRRRPAGSPAGPVARRRSARATRAAIARGRGPRRRTGPGPRAAPRGGPAVARAAPASTRGRRHRRPRCARRAPTRPSRRSLRAARGTHTRWRRHLRRPAEASMASQACHAPTNAGSGPDRRPRHGAARSNSRPTELTAAAPRAACAGGSVVVIGDGGGARSASAHERASARPETRKAPHSRGCSNTATGIRTPVSAVRGRRPSPLDDSGAGRREG